MPTKEKSNFLSIQLVLIVLFVVQVFAVGGLTGWISLRNGHESVKLLINNLLQETSSRVQENLDFYMQVALKMNKINTNSYQLSGLDMSNFRNDQKQYDTLKKYLIQELNFFPTANSIYLANNNGDYIGVLREIRGERESFNYETVDEKLTNGKLRTYEVDRQGNIIKLLNENKFDHRVRPWYVDGLNYGKGKWSGVYPWLFRNILVISYVTPFNDKKGNVTGVITSDIQLHEFSVYLNGLTIGESGETYIMERNGSLISTSNLEQLTKDNGKGGLDRVFTNESKSELIKNTSEDLKKRFKNFYKIKTPEHFTLEVDRKKVLYKVTPVDKKIGLDWLIVVAVPQADFMELVDKNTKMTVILCAIAILIATLIGIIITRKITEPLLMVSDEMHQIANFQLDSKKSFYTPLKEIERIQSSMISMKNGLRSFEKYVSSELVRELIKKKKEAVLGVEHANVTIYFSDVADFTNISESLPLDDLVAMMSDYLGEMTNFIMDSNGTLDKYIGDAIMAFWNAPQKVDNHPKVACKVALDCMEKLSRMGFEWEKKGLPPLKARIGLHTGQALVGNLGSQKRMDYTVLGDAVNLASRLEGLNKYYGTEILVSEDVYHQVKDEFLCRPLDIVTVKGKTEPTRIFELVSMQANSSFEENDFVESYTNALFLYKNKKFTEAKETLELILETHPEDLASINLLQRCVEYELSPPHKDWDGVFVLDKK